MIIRKIEEKDDKKVEKLIRDCLIEFNANKPGCAWSDPNLSIFSKVYSNDNTQYIVVEENNEIIAGCGIGVLDPSLPDVCELQKMYSVKAVRGSGIAQKLLDLSLEFAKKHYKKCYIETFDNMIAANKFYLKNGFIKLDKPLIETEHFACDSWYIKKL